MTRPPCSRTRSLVVVTLKVAAMVVMVAVKITTKGFQHVHIGDRKVSFSVREDLLCDLCLAPFDLHFIRFPAQTHDVCERPVRKDLPEENIFSFWHRPNYSPSPPCTQFSLFHFFKNNRRMDKTSLNLIWSQVLSGGTWSTIKIMSSHSNCIFDDLFRNTPLDPMMYGW